MFEVVFVMPISAVNLRCRVLPRVRPPAANACGEIKYTGCGLTRGKTLHRRRAAVFAAAIGDVAAGAAVFAAAIGDVAVRGRRCLRRR